MSNGTVQATLDPRTQTEVDPSVVLEYINPLGARAAFWTHQTGVPGGQTGTPPSLPAPQISGLSPNTSPANGTGIEIAINGSNFVEGATGAFQAQAIAIGFVSSSQLNGWIGGALMTAPIAGVVHVQNPDGQLSNEVAFTVT